MTEISCYLHLDREQFSFRKGEEREKEKKVKERKRQKNIYIIYF